MQLFHDYQVREIVSLQQNSNAVAFQFFTTDEHYPLVEGGKSTFTVHTM